MTERKPRQEPLHTNSFPLTWQNPLESMTELGAESPGPSASRGSRASLALMLCQHQKALPPFLSQRPPGARDPARVGLRSGQ